MDKLEREKDLKLGFNLDKKEVEKKVSDMLYHNSAYILGKIDGKKEGREGMIQEIHKIAKDLQDKEDRHVLDMETQEFINILYDLEKHFGESFKRKELRKDE